MDQYLYYEGGADKITAINIAVRGGYGQFPSLLFMASESSHKETDKEFYPMPLEEISETLGSGQHCLSLRPNSLPGLYIIKFPKAFFEMNVKVELRGLRQILEPNGTLMDFVIGNETKIYVINVPEAGEQRIVIESCSSTFILEATFKDEKGISDVPKSSNIF